MNDANSSEYEDAAIELLFNGKPQQALELFEEGLRKFPEDPGLCLGGGMALNDLKRPAEAREIFLRLIERSPELTDALQGLAEAELALGNKEAAAAAVRKACDRPGERSADFCHALGLLLYRHRLFADAEHCYRRAVKIDRAHGYSWVGLASCLHQQGQRDEAIRLLKEAVEDRLPGFWEAYSYLGCLLYDAERGEQAKKLLAKIPLDELRDPAAIRRLRSFLDAGQYPERARILAELQKRAGPTQSKEHETKPQAPGQEWLGTFVIGPVRGDYDRLLKILRHIGVVDAEGQWLGRAAGVVVLGPFLGTKRGRLKALRYLEKLQRKANRSEGAGFVALIAAPGEGPSRNQTPACCVDEKWLITGSGASAGAVSRAATAIRNRWYGGGPGRPPFARVLTQELCGAGGFVDGQPESGASSLEVYQGQICSAPGDPEARVEESDKLLRLDSGLGSGLRLLCLRHLDGKWETIELPLAQERFQALKQGFAKTFGMEFPAELEPNPESEPLHPASNGILAFSRVVGQEGVLLPVMPQNFEAAPLGTWMAGQWGYGVNSYAFYYVRRDAKREVFLRLPYGGVYGNPDEDALRVRGFLQRCLAFEEWASSRLDRWGITNNMGSCKGWIERRGGGRREELKPGLAGGFRFPNER